jgi:hypothetical protein
VITEIFGRMEFLAFRIPLAGDVSEMGNTDLSSSQKDFGVANRAAVVAVTG